MSTTFVPFTLTLRAPAILTGLDGDPDSARSLEHVPGSALRGAVARALGDPGSDPKRLERFRELVLSGTVRYLDAYPVSAGRRALPAPLSWRREKYGDTVHDLAAGEPASGDAWETEPLVPLHASFVTLGAAECREVPVARSATIHHQRHREMGRPVEGGLFVYESLDAGQMFRGLIAVEGEGKAQTDARIQAIRDATGETLLLGRSRRAGYGGHATVDWGTPRARELEGRAGLVNADLSPGDAFRLLALSDLLVRDPETGALDPSALGELLETEPGPLDGRVTVERSHLAFRPVGGFNRTWGLELPQALAVRAGSVLVLRAREPIPRDDLLALERTGLGERLPEGFGRIAFFDPPAEQPIVLPPAAEERPSRPEEVPDQVHRMEERLLDEALRRRVLEVAAERIRRADPARLPSPSLLSRLRAPLRSGPAGLAGLRTWLGDSDQSLRSKARQALDHARIGGWERGRTPLLSWLRKTLAMEPADLSSRLGLERLAQRNHLVDEESARKVLDTETTLERARWRLIDQVLALAALEARSNQERRREGSDHGA